MLPCGLESLCQCLDASIRILGTFARCHTTDPTGRSLVEVAPAVLQEPGIQVPVEVSKPVLPAGRCLDCYRPQEGGPVLSRSNNVRHELPVRAAHFRREPSGLPGFCDLHFALSQWDFLIPQDTPCCLRHPVVRRVMSQDVHVSVPSEVAAHSGALHKCSLQDHKPTEERPVVLMVSAISPDSFSYMAT